MLFVKSRTCVLLPVPGRAGRAQCYEDERESSGSELKLHNTYSFLILKRDGCYYDSIMSKYYGATGKFCVAYTA
eukprot:6193903-Pleurochrysis_carterae.AAC.5